MGTSTKRVATGVFVAAAIVLATTAYDSACAETPYGESRLVQCESVEVFLPDSGDSAGGVSATSLTGMLAKSLPRMVSFLAAWRHGNCKTTALAEGQWTVCDDGFSLLEREGSVVATALRLKPNEDAIARVEREAAAADEGIDLPIEDSDCGRFRCSEYLEAELDTSREAYIASLTDRERARLWARLRAWESQQIMQELEKARASNTALHARLEEIAAHEAELAQSEANKRRSRDTYAQARADSAHEFESSD